MNRIDSHPETMKIVIYTNDYRFMASPGRSGQGFSNFYSPIRPGAPLGSGGNNHNE